VPSLAVTVSLLHDFEPIEDILDWEVGVHGLEIKFTHKRQEYEATFLPEVAEEEGWDQADTIIELIEKSGYEGDEEKIIKKIRA